MQTLRLRRLHLLGSNARIYIAQECAVLSTERLHLPYARAPPYMHAPSDACILLTRAEKRCVPFTCLRPRRCARLQECVSKMRAPPARRKDARTDRATGYHDPVSQLPMLLTTFSPTIRNEREEGSGYKKAPSPIVQSP